MGFYLATSFIFPRSFRMRLFAVCFVATHVPLLSYIGWAAATGRLAWPEVITLTLATLVGTGFALFGIGALLSPIHQATEALAAIERQEGEAEAEQGDVVARLLAGVDRAATASREREEALDIVAREDPLTGIYNRRGFLAAYEGLAHNERPGAVALLDIDHFKNVNDRLGHDEGDRVLRAFAGRLSAELRRGDLLARWGGEEFTLLFVGASEDQAAAVLDRIERGLVGRPICELDGRPVTFSAGISRLLPGRLDEAMVRADEALYAAKQAGRNRVLRAASNEFRPD
ncbi:diguanylate cyclase domain-containing protein [Sphingomonas sp. MMS12-HWE2-04]|uniref:diguanylate cyclase domain-containing protein n=1 Tax=Sphingomonas sp. MMS12-HWE2-04 TaxID=3234199 RepID=UPI003850DDD7